MRVLIYLTAPPPHPHHSRYRKLQHRSCANSGAYISPFPLMQHITSHISDISRLTSARHLPRVCFPCFLELTGKLTGNFLFFDTWKRLEYD
jgi:hypothetical protein